MAAVTICSDFVSQENRLSLFPLFPHLFATSDGSGCHELHFFECRVLSQLFHSPLSLSSRGSSLSAIRVVSSAYLSLLIFLPAILITACASSSLTFRMTFLQFSSVQSLSHVRLFATPWIAARQAFLSITNSQSSPKLMSSSWWCYPAISSSIIPFSSCPQSFPASGSFPMSQLFT